MVEIETSVSYELYAPEYGAIHGNVRVAVAETEEEAKKEFDRLSKKYLYVECKKVTTTKEVIMREFPRNTG